MSVYALFIEGYFIKAEVNPNVPENILYRFIDEFYYRSFARDPMIRLIFDWRTKYRVRVFKRNIMSFIPIKFFYR